MMLAVEADGANIETVEELADEQSSFGTSAARCLQCGYTRC